MSEHAECLVEYRGLRTASQRVNHELVKRLPKDAFDEGGLRLGLMHKGALDLKTQDELAILVDFCIHDVRRQGLNEVDRFLAEKPYSPGSDEMRYLDKLLDARYSLFMVEKLERGVGIEALDVATGNRVFIVDIGFSTSAAPGLVFVGRMVHFDHFAFSTGTIVPIAEVPKKARAEWLAEHSKKLAEALKSSTRAQWSELTAAWIRDCLSNGVSSQISYQEPNSRLDQGSREPPLSSKKTVGRNDPCPCGSGKKYKKCHGFGA